MKPLWVESAGLGPVAPLNKDQSLYGQPVPTQTPEAAGVAQPHSQLGPVWSVSAQAVVSDGRRL